METIVVAYDGTVPAGRALTRAADLARLLEARLVVTSVAAVEELPGSTTSAGVHLDLPVLSQARAILEKRGVDAEYQPALGDVPDAIVEVAARSDASLIVLGTREPGMMDRMLGHSVSHAVLRMAVCDVLVVRR